MDTIIRQTRCEDCGEGNGNHKSFCTKAREGYCDECGMKKFHLPTCSMMPSLKEQLDMLARDGRSDEHRLQILIFIMRQLAEKVEKLEIEHE